MSATADGGRPRAIDHLVLPFETLVAARNVFHAMGFTVAPDAVHPFGTGNACIFFADGTYLEPLAKVDLDAYAAARHAGQLFVVNDAAFRAGHALPAISAMAFKSSDAVADRAELGRAGIGEDGLVEFRRTFETPDGDLKDMAFRLAFARPDDSLEATAFFCQPLHDRAPDRTALSRHTNGVTGLLRIVCGGADFKAIADRIAAVGRSSVPVSEDSSRSLIVSLANCVVEIAPSMALVARYGEGAGSEAGTICGLVLGTDDLASTRRVLEAADIAAHSFDERVVVPLGSSACFIAFEEVSP